MITLSSLSPTARRLALQILVVEAAWRDVREKAKRLRAEGKVSITDVTSSLLIGKVEGDHGVYETDVLYRAGTQKVAYWSCDCKWGEWAYDRTRYYGRPCSHNMALRYEAQSRGMWGRTVQPDLPGKA